MEYSIERMNGEAGLRRVAGVFERNGNAKSLDGLRWMYVENSAGGSVSCMAVSSEGDDAAVYSIMKVRVLIHGREVVASQSIDTLTDSHHRGKGLFSKLASATYEAADGDGVALVYGFPNSNSAPGFFKRLNWVRRDYPPYVFYLNNLVYPIKKKVGRNSSIMVSNFISSSLLWAASRFGGDRSVSIVEMDTFKGVGYDALWAKFSEKLDIVVNRDSEYMEWRFVKKPGFDYKIRGIFVDGSLVAVAVFIVLEKHGGKVGYLMEFIHDPAHELRAGALMRGVVREICKMGVDVILAWNRAEYINSSIYKKSLFLSLPRILQPIKLYFGIRWLGDKNTYPDFGIDNFYVSYADSDTV